VADAAESRGVHVLDAPITVVPQRVRAGESMFLVGGPDDLVRATRGHLEALGGVVYHFGPLGSGNIAKLAKNLVNAAQRVVLAEALRLIEAGGVDRQKFIDVLVADDRGSLIAQWRKIISIEGHQTAILPASHLLEKDIALAAELARSYGLDLPVTEGAAATAARWVKAWTERSSLTEPTQS
jgi:3-hydroxyisobutyrate dehydrogenase-like beta-hydroxyacid dehydrogenase